MITLLRFKLIIVLTISTALSLSVEGGPFYVVVGTFSEETSARRFATSIGDLFSEASFRFDSGRNLYYVHVMETSQQDEAENFRRYLKKENGFGNAWIFTDLASGESPDYGDMRPSEDHIKMELYTGGSVLLGSADNNFLSISKNKGEIKETLRQATGKAFTFIAETHAGRSVPAKVLLMNKTGIEISAFKTGEVVSFSGKELTHILMLVCQVPGYSTETKIIDLGNLANASDTSQNSDGIWEVRFPLTKLEIDEVTLLYHSVFYADAAVLQPPVKKQVDVLLSLMQTNPHWKIVINSHCNPGVKREIMVPGKEKNYFDISEAVGRPGSDKQLTRERAETLSDYFVERGIESKRITVMGWGSLNLLVKDTDKNSDINDRLEVEVIGG